MQTFADCWVWRSIYPYKLPRPDVQLLNARAVLGHFFNSVGFHRDFCESYDCGVLTTTFGTFSWTSQNVPPYPYVRCYFYRSDGQKEIYRTWWVSSREKVSYASKRLLEIFYRAWGIRSIVKWCWEFESRLCLSFPLSCWFYQSPVDHTIHAVWLQIF